MDSFNLREHQHQRYNPLIGEWILVSPHRCKRPWQGQIEKVERDHFPENDSKNPLCPGSIRPNGVKNPFYTSTFVFTNDFPALLEDCPEPKAEDDPLFGIQGAKGTCKVICFHPKTAMHYFSMTIQEIINVIQKWIEEINEIGQKLAWVQIFENRGSVMGCSNPHPHCQIWASNFLPNEPRKKDECQRSYFKKYGKPMLMEYVKREIIKKERLILENNDWIVVVPWWALWPYETMILPKRHIKRLTEIEEGEKESLAEIIKKITIKYDNLFHTSFPYSFGWHGAPTGEFLERNNDHWVLHGAFYPPLLRSASIKKFMVGYEMFAQPQRDLTAEQAAENLKNSPEIHYYYSSSL